MKKNLLLSLTLLSLLLAFTGCSQQQSAAPAAKTTVLKVGATAVPHAEILAAIKPDLAKEGIDLQIVEMTDYVRPNLAVADKELDANFFQHIPYLEKFSSERKLALTYTAKVHIEPMGIYSRSVKDLTQLSSGSKIAIPNDPTNGGRALALLAKAGILTLKDGVGVHATVQDITANPKQVKIVELEAPQLPRSLDDVALAVINTNYALEAKLVPTKDALLLEQKDSPYANILAVRTGDEKRPEIQKLTAALTSDKVRKFIEEKYQGAVVPAF
ncbi:MetQ/NlpA family ABC transporter substrate-binding protein [Azotosporobacter soli]|uniref:MetQ/NlpA family ABC transporter substrate-binding protein n=1 Tax=Azotosporobacter soli TaxID=3055040 RepID=UPI0031FF12F9